MLRIYLVLSVLWIGLIVAVSIGDRPVPVARFGSVADTPVNSPAKRPKSGAWFTQSAPIPPGVSPLLKEAERSGDWELWQHVVRYWEIQSALAFAPPAVGYLVLFGILPWVGRGFRSTYL
jgi:hypothetical protein